MSGFDTRWLDLREVADHAARDRGLRQRVTDHVMAVGEDATVVDLGAGTGSTLRALLPEAQHWRWKLVDNDANLLAEAGSRHGLSGRVECVEAHLDDISVDTFDGSRLVTASALFDLVSEDFLAGLVAQLVQADVSLYAALNYDGICHWDDPHPMDEEVVAAFNTHQQSDKGFGPALGPAATPSLRKLLEGQSFHVAMAPSPWRLDPSHAELQRQFVSGMATAAAETGLVSKMDVNDWQSARLERAENSSCFVGHWDLFAFR
ncbi:class I SAM-dependent methyltransferase [Aliirhizobium smilacinae]|uniref:Class I SAM-dependent methyltransferase n=1 Tax=Aliirhizobium smilacinae TaxID=1395944 RepID=A0A5C4XE24_9HYPH|nr:class I SAM-dependent methyltransferase [Rhizobium smilacinae]TNM61745.1 class I SAM-dependent methyltransferase [Rhizobium smilacinae]